MEELLLKVSELLGMSVDGLMTYYPELRSQMAWYGMLDTISRVIFIVLVTAPITLSILYVAVDMADYYFWDKHLDQNLIIKLVVGLLALTVIASVLYGLKFVFATDIMMIRYLFNG